MRRRAKWTVWLGLAAALSAPQASLAQNRGMGACCAGSPVELKGRIARVQITPGEGMPYLIVRSGGREAKVFLGSMRYLMSNGFNPKLDEEVVAKAYKTAEDEYVAAAVTLTGPKKTLQLRDDDGRPMWRGGRNAR